MDCGGSWWHLTVSHMTQWVLPSDSVILQWKISLFPEWLQQSTSTYNTNTFDGHQLCWHSVRLLISGMFCRCRNSFAKVPDPSLGTLGVYGTNRNQPPPLQKAGWVNTIFFLSIWMIVKQVVQPLSTVRFSTATLTMHQKYLITCSNQTIFTSALH